MTGENAHLSVFDVLNKCGHSNANWLNLGLGLGLLKKADVSCCLTVCLSIYGLSLWLSRLDNVISGGEPTYDSLSDALQSINEVAVVEKLDIESKFYHAMFNIRLQIMRSTWKFYTHLNF